MVIGANLLHVNWLPHVYGLQKYLTDSKTLWEEGSGGRHENNWININHLHLLNYLFTKYFQTWLRKAQCRNC